MGSAESCRDDNPYTEERPCPSCLHPGNFEARAPSACVSCALCPHGGMSPRVTRGADGTALVGGRYFRRPVDEAEVEEWRRRRVRRVEHVSVTGDVRWSEIVPEAT